MWFIYLYNLLICTIFVSFNPTIDEIEELKKRYLEFNWGSKLILASQELERGEGFLVLKNVPLDEVPILSP